MSGDEAGFSEEQRQALDRAIAAFRQHSGTEEYWARLQDLEKRRRFFQEELPARLDGLSEADVLEIVRLLWAHRMWGNKGYVARQLVQQNGLEGLHQGLRLLYSAEVDPEEAYTRFLSAVKGWGPASVTEMLACIHPERCGVWNEQARAALKLLGFAGRLNLSRYRLSEQEYRRFNRLLQAIAEEIRRAGFQDVDLLLVDYFLYVVAAGQSGTPRPAASRQGEGPRAAAGEFDHNEIRDLIAAIGQNLGFETATEATVAKGARVDVVWQARIGNLGMVTYVFEVHRSGSVDSLILNLQKALNGPTVQKVIAVSDRNQLQRIEGECASLPEPFRRALRLWDVEDVVEVYRALGRAMELIDKLGLLESNWRPR